jgi:hypothetical protein
MMGAALHPAHRSVVPCLDPPLELEPGAFHGVGARKAALSKAEPRRFCFYCFLKALPVIHWAAVHPWLVFS